MWQEWGIYFWFEHDGGHHRLVLCDAIGAHRVHGPAYRRLRYQASEARIDEEHIHTLTMSSALTVGAVRTIDYDYTRPRADLSITREAPQDTAWAQQEHYIWGDYTQPLAGAGGAGGQPNLPHQEAEHLARVHAEAFHSQGLRARGAGHLRGLIAGQTFMLTHYPEDAANREYLVVSCALTVQERTETSQSPSGPRFCYESQFEIQPANTAFHLQRTLEKPRAGPEIAIIVGPQGREIWTDTYGRVKVQFPWDRQGRGDERSSCWVRVSSAWQGDGFGASHVPRIGQEVLIGHVQDDPDLPMVIGRMVNASQMPAWELPGNQALSGIRSRELGGTRANHLLMDDTQGQLQMQLSSDHALSQLNLGHITRVPGSVGRQDARGEGFELRTDAHGALRAAQGMLISTDARPNAQGHAKDMGEVHQRLSAALDTQARLTGADQAEIVRAIHAQNEAIRGNANTAGNAFPELTQPHLTLSSPAGIQATTAGSTHLASADHLALTTGGHVCMAAGKSWFARVRDSFKVLAHKLGIQLVAASGKVQVHAHDDAIELVARRAVEIMSAEDWINLTAKEGIRLQVGKTMLSLTDDGIRGFTPGVSHMHAADHQDLGPVVVPATVVAATGISPLTEAKQSHVTEHFVLAEHGSGLRLPAQRYRVTLDDGRTVEGTSNAQGETDLVMSDSLQIALLELLRHDGTNHPIALFQPALTQDAGAVNTPPALAMEKQPTRRQRIGTREATANAIAPTSQGYTPQYARCSPNNWGMRYSTADESRRGQLAFPVVRAYAKAMRACLLEQVQWGSNYFGPEGGSPVLRLQWPLSDVSKKQLIKLIHPIVGAALSAPSPAGFGIPKAAWPKLSIRTLAGSSAMGTFTVGTWVLEINASALEGAFGATTNAEGRRICLGVIRELAKTLYHEARHCQQAFWVYAMAQQQPQNFPDTPAIMQWPTIAAGRYAEGRAAAALAAEASIPDEPTALIGIKRMAVGQYLWTLNLWRQANWYPSYAPNKADLEHEYANARKAAIDLLQHIGIGGTSIDVDKMVAQPYELRADYTGRPWEDDAFYCEQLTGNYWDGSTLELVAADQCSRAHELASRSPELASRHAEQGSGGQ